MQPVIVENRPGANGIIGADGFTKSPPDGYTILFATGPVFTDEQAAIQGPAVRSRPRFHPVIAGRGGAERARHLSQIADVEFPRTDRLCPAHPGELTFASQGNGSSGHLAGTLLDQLAKIEMKHIPYRGASWPGPT